ncbi:MAG: hypothetical protein ACKUBY_03810 [Candidatus Moraniibacteriota bacterium]
MICVGEDEMKNNQFVLKDMFDGEGVMLGRGKIFSKIMIKNKCK